MRQSTLFGWTPVEAKAAAAAAAAGGAETRDTTMVVSDGDKEESFDTPPPEDKLASAGASMANVTQKRASTGLVPEVSIYKRAKTQNEAASTSNGTDTSGQAQSNAKNTTVADDQALCHQHRAKCSTPTIRCTFMKSNGERCRAHYCAHSLHKFYGLDRDALLSKERTLDDGEHVSSDTASYTWKCPKCSKSCLCSACVRRDANRHGRVPLAKAEENSSSPFGAQIPPEKTKPTVLPTKQSNKRQASAKQTHGKKNKSKEKEGAHSNSPLLNGFLKKTSLSESTRSERAGGSTTDSSKRARQQTLLPAPRKAPPKPAAPPAVAPMKTRLPVENLLARIWLYETLVRFDILDVPKKILAVLDRFDVWTEDQLRVIFERLLIFLCEISNIRAAPQGKKFGGILKTYQEHSNDPNRGEAWEAIRSLCEGKNVVPPTLADVEILSEQLASAHKINEIDPADTLLGSRSLSGRRAATTAALARVKSISARENRKGDYSSDEDEEHIRSSRRARRGKAHVTSSISEDEDDDFNGDDDSAKGDSFRRNSGVTRKPIGQRGPSPQRRSARNQEKSQPPEIKEPESGVDSSDEGTYKSTAGDRSFDTAAEEHKAPAMPVPMPGFEQRVSVLCAFTEFLLQKKVIADEIVESIEKSRELEKQLNSELKELAKQQEDEMRAMIQKRNDMRSVGKAKQWQAENERMLKEHEYARIDLRMSIWLPMEAYKARAGPLGTDVDGNEYWHLTEFNEQKPADTSGQWSWSLLILGQGYPESQDSVREEVSSVAVEVGLSHDQDSSSSLPVNDSRCFRATNDVEELAKIVAYVRYRQRLLDYEELADEQRKDEEDLVAQQKQIEAEVASSSTSFSVDEPLVPFRSPSKARQKERSKAKDELLQMQDARRERIDSLVRQLTHVKEYYMWHHGGGEEQ